MRKAAKAWPGLLAGLAMLAALAPFIYPYFFIFPGGDDFDHASRAAFFGDLPSAIYEIARQWLGWSGRFAYHFLAVFLGQAATSRALSALVCMLPACLLLLAGLIGFGRAAWAMLALLLFYAPHDALPGLYNITDALSLNLQAAAFALFLALEAKGRPKAAALAAICAAGLYEHAAIALAVYCAAAAALGRAPRYWPAMLCACALALLAPGNFQRMLARREALGQISGFPLESLPLWLAAGCALGLLLAPEKRDARLALAAPLAFAAFCGLLWLLHAASDQPLGQAPKFAASLGFYGACAAALCLANLPKPRHARLCALILAALVLAASPNPRPLLHNAASGAIAEYGRFMAQRMERLESLGHKEPWKFGIYGEIARGGKRKRPPLAAEAELALPRLKNPAFPLAWEDPLKMDPKAWPNPWAAWLFGFKEIKVE